MITASEAYKMALKENETLNKEYFDTVMQQIEFDITSEALSGSRSTLFRRDEFECRDLGIEFVIDELRRNGFRVRVGYDETHTFQHMRVSW